MDLVVGVALAQASSGAGRVLACRRAHPAALAGSWEFPGGKVEPGEDPAATAVREIREELGCTIEVTGWLAATTRISEALELRVAVAEVVAGEPVPLEHDAVRWLRAGELGQVEWLPADTPFLAEVGGMLTG